MKRHCSNTNRSKLVYTQQQSSLLSDAGVYSILLASILLGVMTVCSLAIDGVKLSRAQLWAQRAADAAAISGAGRIARDPRVLEEKGIAAFSTEVAEVALYNLYLRKVINDDGRTMPSTTVLASGDGVVSRVDNAVIRVRIAPGTKRVETDVRFDNEYILMDLFGAGTFREVRAEAQAEVGTALVSLLLDTSYSMRLGSKMEDLRQAVRIFSEYFDPQRDRISIIAFGSDAEVMLPVEVSNANGGFATEALESSLENVRAAGATNVTAALRKAYEQTLVTSRAQPNWFEESQVAYVLFSDGSPTAATLEFTDPKPNLAQNPSGSGIYDYVSLSGNKRAEPLAPLRLISAPLGSTGVDSDEAVDQAKIPSCSFREGDYSAEHSIAGCLTTLAFTLPNDMRTSVTLGTEQFEELYQYSAIAWADYLRAYPPRPSAPEQAFGGRFYTIGYGDPVPPACTSATEPWDNAYGGDCADLRKDNFLARLAYDQKRMARINRSYPEVGIDPDLLSPGRSLTAPVSEHSLEQMFRQIAVHLRLRLIL